MDNLRVCIIGVGTMGQKHLNVFATTPGAEIAGVCDLNYDSALETVAAYGPGIKCYTSYDRMIEEQQPDAVAIAVPDHLHRDPAIAAMTAGAHVLVEKPLATTLSDADAMIECAEKSDKILMVNYTHRWVPAYYTAYEKITGGELGKAAMVYAKKNDSVAIMSMWPWLRDSSPAAFLSSHDIDLTRWFIGCEAVSVYARGYKKVLRNKLGCDTYDCIQALTEFENGAFATFESSFIYPDTYPTLTDSYIQINCEDGVIELPRKAESIRVASPSSCEYPKTGIAAVIDGKIQGAFRLANEHFIDCIRTGKQPMTDGYNARQVSEIVEAIHRSLATGEIVRLPLA